MLCAEKDNQIMSRKIRYGLRIAWNILRLPLMKLFSLGKISTPWILLLSPKGVLRVESGGNIRVENSLNMEPGAMLYAAGGNILIKGAFINRNCTIVSMDNIKIGNSVTIGPNVCIFDHDHNTDLNQGASPYVCKKVVIGDNVWIGAQAVILKGVHIGKNAVIAAGAVVTKDVPDNCIAMGVPATVKDK